MNGDLLLKVADAIESTGRFNLNYWVSDGTFSFNGSTQPIDVVENCKMTACIGGWTLAVEGVRVPPGTVSDSSTFIAKTAARLLDLGLDTAERLFFADAGSIWHRVADDYDWAVTEECGLDRWQDVLPEQAAHVLRRLAHGELVL